MKQMRDYGVLERDTVCCGIYVATFRRR